MQILSAHFYSANVKKITNIIIVFSIVHTRKQRSFFFYICVTLLVEVNVDKIKHYRQTLLL